jgi:hypothetical protein
MVCTRADGSFAASDLGPSLPYHDLAHYVVESALQLKQGFFGHMAGGYSPAQLGDKDIIATLPAESWFAEALARTLGSLHTGACTAEQFPEIIRAEMQRFNYDTSTAPTAVQARALLAEYQRLLDRWNALGQGESLNFEFAV